jgi:hypothetical protein
VQTTNDVFFIQLDHIAGTRGVLNHSLKDLMELRILGRAKLRTKVEGEHSEGRRGKKRAGYDEAGVKGLRKLVLGILHTMSLVCEIVNFANQETTKGTNHKPM